MLDTRIDARFGDKQIIGKPFQTLQELGYQARLISEFFEER
ncbi:hypothetical protein CES86_5145 [Brucella lupini]|uniref:Uncharacterized protein n=1 Tax=Brucella lupini TaxID=255457 RepID=A0A256GBV6_9HYPH|nr:hypothetical protein CES86_5145 [Brucella lupini]